MTLPAFNEWREIDRIMGGEAQAIGATNKQRCDARPCQFRRQLASSSLASCHHPTPFMGEQHGKLRRAAAPCKHGDPSWEAGAFFDERRMDNHSRGSVRPLPPCTSEER